MNNNLIFILLLSFGFSFSSFSQTSFCPDFSITGVYQDTIDPSTYQVSVEFSAPDSIFVGYTLISSVLDCNGDTIATGNLFWFGQIGQTTQDYPITLIGQPNCAPYTAVFTYMDELGDIDTCMLLYSVADLEEMIVSNKSIMVYPNPTNGLLTIRLEKAYTEQIYHIFDQQGRMVKSDVLNGKQTVIELNLNNGMYYLMIGQEVVKVQVVR